MTDKEFEERRLELGRYRATFNRLQRIVEDLQRWREIAHSVSRPVDLPRGKGSPSNGGGGVASVVGTIAALESQAADLAVRAVAQREQLLHSIAQLSSERQRDLLERIYLNGQTQDRVSEDWQVSHRTIRRELVASVISLKDASDFFD